MNTDIKDLTRAELLIELGRRKAEEAKTERREKRKFNPGLPQEMFEKYLSWNVSVNWKRLCEDNWAIMYENEDGDIYGSTANSEEEIRELIDEVYSQECDVLHVIKDGKEITFKSERVTTFNI